MIVGVTRVRCPGCDREHEHKLVQSINAATDAAEKAQLLAGELNILHCECGRRSQLAATVLYHDPAARFWGQVCPGGDAAMAEGEAAFRAAGAGGTQRLVPSQNALIEKVKILDAGLDDWAVEMLKVLLLASREDRDVERILLFDRADADVLHWIVFADNAPRTLASPRGAYDRLRARPLTEPGPHDYRIDRAWAMDAVRAMIAATN